MSQKLVRGNFIAQALFQFIKESLNKSFDKLRTNGKSLIPFVLSLSKHEHLPFDWLRANG